MGTHQVQFTYSTGQILVDIYQSRNGKTCSEINELERKSSFLICILVVVAIAFLFDNCQIAFKCVLYTHCQHIYIEMHYLYHLLPYIVDMHF